MRRQHHLRDGLLQPLRDGGPEAQDADHFLGHGHSRALALGDLPLLRGFWSKDAIVASAYDEHYYVLFGMAL